MEAEDLLAAALTPRPERVEDGILAISPPELREGLRSVREMLSFLGRELDPKVPDPWLRERLLKTIAARAPRRALLVVDMIVDHLTPGALAEVPRARDVVPALQARIASARAAGIPVVYVVDEHEADDPDLDAWGTHAVKGTEGANVWAELAPLPGDRIVHKPSYSAFYGSALEPLLEELGVDTLVLTGCLTEIGIAATAMDAYQRGFAVEIPADSQAGSCAEAEAAAMGTLRVMAPFGRARKARLDRLAA